MRSLCSGTSRRRARRGLAGERIHLEPASGAGETQDAEACARRDGYVYVLGSQFGSKAGPLSSSRSWIARVPEAALGGATAPRRYRSRGCGSGFTGRSTTRSPAPGSS